jgi:hypothetical protein
VENSEALGREKMVTPWIDAFCPTQQHFLATFLIFSVQMQQFTPTLF